FYERRDTLSLGVCNGCQLMAALELIPGMDGQLPSLHHNASGKFESAFLSVDIPRNDTVMLGSLSGSRLGIWVAHGEGRFSLPGGLQDHLIPMKYTHAAYPGNPNGSDFQAAAVASADGRHLAMMPHLERAFMPWHWAWYPQDRHADEITPWVEAFVNARKWVEERLPEPLYEQA
ncbi:MAG TPA: phosphoribosylformylglycinamidine synthase subunit PurQ, partial [Bacteroidales bacterium]|nr:phosphoribosylformylglycinamidine synthase subunit PurQ [Bacteroidales bacterium]